MERIIDLLLGQMKNLAEILHCLVLVDIIWHFG